MNSKAQDILNIIDNTLRVFDKGNLRLEVQKNGPAIEVKVEYKNQAYRGQVGYDESKGGVWWKFNPDFYPDEGQDEDDFLDCVFNTLQELS